MTSERIAMIADQPDPDAPKEMRSFLGLAEVYSHMVKNFANVSTPLTALFNVTPAEFNEVKNDPDKCQQVVSAIDILIAAMLLNPALAL
jgi:hypothetical protein